MFPVRTPCNRIRRPSASRPCSADPLSGRAANREHSTLDMSAESASEQNGTDRTPRLSGAERTHDKLIRSYRKKLELHPSFKERAALEDLMRSIEPEDVMCADIEYYLGRMQKLQEKRYDMYSGFHQNCGNLVVFGTRVLFSCCRDMARSLCFGDAHVHEGRLYVCDRAPERCAGNDASTYVISNGRSIHMDHCPFCGAQVRYLEMDPENEKPETR